MKEHFIINKDNIVGPWAARPQPWRYTFLIRKQKTLKCRFFARFLTNEYLRYTFLKLEMHIFTHFCTLLHIFCTWETRTPPIKYWPSTARIFDSWTLYYKPLTLWCKILSCMSFSILQKRASQAPTVPPLWKFYIIFLERYKNTK